MRRRRSWLAPLLFVSALAMAPGSGPAAGSELETCLAAPPLAKQIACLAKAAIAARDPALCERIANPDVKTVCAFDPEKLE